MTENYFCTQEREEGDKERRGKEKWWQGEEITAQILFITMIHTSHGEVYIRTSESTRAQIIKLKY